MEKILSDYNIIGKVSDTNEYFIVNVLSGEADIISKEMGESLLNGIVPDENAFSKKGYFVDAAYESLLFQKKYKEFLDRRDSDEIQLFFVPWYACNFKCQYCFQSEYVNENQETTSATIDAFFAFIDKKFSSRKKYITLFGGEPLLDTPNAKNIIEEILKKSWSRGLDVSIVTNGYTLKNYIEILKQGPIREIQVTLDGTEKIHDSRRALKGTGNGTFKKIVEGIDCAMNLGIKINVRMVADKDNLDNLPELALFAIEKKWTENSLFKTQIGRNYELHHCSSDPKKLYSRIELYQKLTELIAIHSSILEFHRPAYSLARFLSENGKLPEPIFDSCPGCKTEWAFDYTGAIYSCTATVGNAKDRLGTFYPEILVDEKAIEQWKTRDITTIDKCKSCSARLVCGGGCAAVARTQLGDLHAPDCRPISELVGLGLSVYFKNEVNNE